MRKLRIISLMALLGLLLWAGCAKRKNPLITTPEKGSYRTFLSAPLGYTFTALAGNKLGLTDASGKRTIHAYLPPGHPEITHQSSPQKYPALYLLADFNENSEQFGQFYQLASLSDQLIAEGLMDSLVIFVISGEMQGALFADLGGTFYANNFLIGDWPRFIAEQLIPQLDTFYIQLKLDPSRRAIAGLGMGGYGAFRIALEYNTMFDVVGAMSAPLAFGGTDPSGWLKSFLIPTVMGENGNSYANIQVVSPFDASKPASSWMIAMSTAFSPRTDTTDKSGVTYRPIPKTHYGVDIPFDASDLVPFVVSEWMDWDIENLLNSTYSGALSGKKVYLDCGDGDQFDFDVMNRRFDTFLTGKGVTHVYHEYSGYPGHDAAHGIFTYDRMKALFKYISDNM